jgi:hypothetical protein
MYKKTNPSSLHILGEPPLDSESSQAMHLESEPRITGERRGDRRASGALGEPTLSGGSSSSGFSKDEDECNKAVEEDNDFGVVELNKNLEESGFPRYERPLAYPSEFAAVRITDFVNPNQQAFDIRVSYLTAVASPDILNSFISSLKLTDEFGNRLNQAVLIKTLQQS